MTGSNGEPGSGRKRNRFIIHEGEIEITGQRAPGPEEQEKADRLFSRILKNRKKGRK
jgi:hypothetical protein